MNFSICRSGRHPGFAFAPASLSILRIFCGILSLYYLRLLPCLNLKSRVKSETDLVRPWMRSCIGFLPLLFSPSQLSEDEVHNAALQRQLVSLALPWPRITAKNEPDCLPLIDPFSFLVFPSFQKSLIFGCGNRLSGGRRAWLCLWLAFLQP